MGILGALLQVSFETVTDTSAMMGNLEGQSYLQMTRFLNACKRWPADRDDYSGVDWQSVLSRLTSQGLHDWLDPWVGRNFHSFRVPGAREGSCDWTRRLYTPAESEPKSAAASHLECLDQTLKMMKVFLETFRKLKTH